MDGLKLPRHLHSETSGTDSKQLFVTSVISFQLISGDISLGPYITSREVLDAIVS